MADRIQVGDPTDRTTQVLLREIASLKEVVFTRLDGMDRAIVLLHDNLTRAPTDVDKQIEHLKELIFGRFDRVDVKFQAVQTQIVERDASVEKTARDTKTAVDAALAAAKELSNKQADSFALSIGKSETTTTKQIDQLGVIIQQNTKASDEKIGDIKDRLTRIEGTGKGRGDMLGWIVAGISALAAVVSIAFALTRGP